MALVFRHPESDYTPQPDKESAVKSPAQGFSMFANKGWLTKEDGGGLDKPVLGVR